MHSPDFFRGADPYLIRSRAFWRGVTYVMIGASVLWGLPLATPGSWHGTSVARLEGLLFSAAFVGLALVAVIQGSGRESFDRYGFPLVFGAAFLLAISLARREEVRRVPGDRAHPAPLLVRGGPAVDPLAAAELSA